MNHEEATKHAQSFFKTYPKVDTFHITTDGQVFAEKHQADAHAKSLVKDPKTEPVVHTVERNAVEKVKEAKQEKTQEEKDKEAAEKKAAAIAKAAATRAKNAAAKAGK